ncbi:MAG: type II toxin-antitoxin system VapC family toxin [Acidobacteriia bacterium]|nr:type II toxin-antitoxin system VapC family toxin [Terriglobia bacterium]
MRVLLDTHALLWWWGEENRLSPRARKLIADEGNEILVSAASAWEISTKVRLGKLLVAIDLVRDFSDYLSRDGFFALPITAEHGLRAGLLPGPHKDPFDRMLVAQSQMEAIPIVSNEEVFDSYGARRIW